MSSRLLKDSVFCHINFYFVVEDKKTASWKFMARLTNNHSQRDNSDITLIFFFFVGVGFRRWRICALQQYTSMLHMQWRNLQINFANIY